MEIVAEEEEEFEEERLRQILRPLTAIGSALICYDVFSLLPSCHIDIVSRASIHAYAAYRESNLLACAADPIPAHAYV